MNETSEIVVRSPCGKTNPFTVERIVKQGTVTGPQLCKVSTAEYGHNTPGFQLGAVNVKPPIFVDDILGLNNDIVDTSESHKKAVLFSYRKRLDYSKPKCLYMIVNGKKSDIQPVLEIDEHVIEQVSQSKYVGDIFNHKGTNSDLIEDRIRKGKGEMISLLALGEESSLGKYTIQTMILLYSAKFVQMVIFNSCAWSHITKTNTTALERLQLRFLKLILLLPMSTPNVFIFLEYGILPLGYEIQKRRMIYLHHVLTVEERDPVRQVYEQGLRLVFEPNWANDVKHLRSEYENDMADEQVAELDYDKWKEIVTEAVEKKVFTELLQSAKASSKCKDLEYESFGVRGYLTSMSAKSARKIARLRSKMFVCKSNHKSSHKDLVCRACGVEEETQDHLINCRQIHGDEAGTIDVPQCVNTNPEDDLVTVDALLKRMTSVEQWLEENVG